MTEQKQPIYADITNRLFASTLDLAIIYVPLDFITRFIFALVYPNGNAFSIYSSKVVAQYPELAQHADKVMQVIQAQYPLGMVEIINQFFFLAGLQFFLIGLYFVPATKIYGTTLAKKIIGVKVVDSTTGKDISYSQSFIRYIAYLPSIGFFGLGLITGGLNKRKRCWHDILADTVVVYDQNRWYKRQVDKIKKWLHLK